MIHMKDICKSYEMGESIVRALDHVNLNIAPREFVAIVGPSGSGKSTLMNMIGCLDVPDSGSYYLDGQNVSELDENELSEIRSRKIGFIFQQFNLLPKMTAYENVELPLIYQRVGAKERHERVESALCLVGLEKRMRHRPTELSGGQQQRVAIARALATQPSIILADEPTGNLDSRSGDEVMHVICELSQKGNTIVLITHNDKIAEQAGRQLYVSDGKIIGGRSESGDFTNH